ncbi:hypothetical protein [Maricaulis maris]|uniref:Spore coat polysaccharide biosynthesis predicted glycosyltransferase SpsG n=1 Tax=Maricaulis maris TaxID=74318 RepID=A0A495DD31_9PROT|nr:hypothetical protein [Maricaulis maris]RKR00173.1 spore coat polysaccharide biosynthesis predicted glycosyltransferase SpsG [Maricaulis maris]
MTARFAIRTDGSTTIGLGHVMRCGALANALVAEGAEPLWLTTTPQHRPADLAPGIEVVVLADDDELGPTLDRHGIRHLVADWKFTEADRVAALRAAGRHVSLIGNFLHGAVPDLHVRQGFLPALSPSGAAALSGPKYLLLSDAYRALPTRQTADRANRILVSLGGTITPVLDRIRERLAETFSGLIDWRGPASNGPVPPLAQALRQADIGILAGGTTLHEAAATGLPTLCVPIASNQLDRAEQFESVGLGISLNPDDPGFDRQFEAALETLMRDAGRRGAMARNGQALVDGDGAGRVARHLIGLAATA